MRLTFALGLLLLLAACQQRPSESVRYYDYAHPDQVWELPKALGEASGVCIAGKDSLALIADESLSIYFFSPSKGKIIDSIPSSLLADIEDIALVEGKFHLLGSDGRLYVRHDSGWQIQQIALSTKSNPEGMALDAAHNRLLIACKGKPLDGNKGQRSIHALHLQPFRFDTLPIFRISTTQIARHPAGKAAMAQLQKASPKRNGRPRADDMVFQPSAIAVHPFNGRYFILSASSALLAEYSPQGSLMDLHALPRTSFPKAEGICFDPDGTLYIVSERGCKDCHATLGAFEWKTK